MQQSRPKLFGVTFLAAASSCVLLSSRPVAAQPRVATPTPRLPFALDNQAAIDKALGLTEQEELSKTAVSLKVKDATLEELVAEVQRVLPAAKNIEVRDALPVRLSFELKEVLAGQALQSAAALAGCELHIFPDRLLIAPLSKLSKEESKDRFPWMPGTKLQSSVFVRQMFVKVIAENVQRRDAASAARPGGGGATGVLVGDLEPELQQMVERLARWSMRGLPADVPRTIVSQDTRVSVFGEINELILRIAPSRQSDPKAKVSSLELIVVNAQPAVVQR